MGRGANGKETDGAAGQSLPGQSSGQTGNTSSDTANNAGGNGGKSGTGGGSSSGTNPRGEGGPAVWWPWDPSSDNQVEVVVPAAPPHPSS